MNDEEWAERGVKWGIPDTPECRHAWETVLEANTGYAGRYPDDYGLTQEQKFASMVQWFPGGDHWTPFVMDPNASKEEKEYLKQHPQLPQDRDECLEHHYMQEFLKACGEALIDGNHQFFRRMEKAVKLEADGGIENKFWEKYEVDPISRCYWKLQEFVKKKHKLPTVAELQELAGLSNSPNAWQRVNETLNLQGKLPRSNAV
jgi:hypothetical protein